jgi:toxin ParE1/3/4
MSHKVIFDIAAQADLADLYDYLLPRAGERDARAYVGDIFDYCVSFETFPERGARSNKRPGLRIVGFHRKATIAFEVADDTVIILRVFHRGRNVDFDPDTDNE